MFKGNEDFQNLCQEVKSAETSEINLYNNQIGDEIGTEGAKALAHAIRSNTNVTRINLYGNKIGDEGAAAIANALLLNTLSAVTELNLYDNDIGVEGAKAIAELLENNTVITTIHLSYNKIGEEGAAAIANALLSNTSSAVTNLYLGGNYIGQVNEKIIDMLLEVNKKIAENELDKEMKLKFLSKSFIDKHNNEDDCNTNTNEQEMMEMGVAWKWSDDTWNTLNKDTSSGTGLLTVLHTVLMYELRENDESVKEAIKTMIESDTREVDGVVQTFFHVIVGKYYDPIVTDFFKMFGNEFDIDVDKLQDSNNRSVREIAISNNNKDVVDLARSWGRYLDRYMIDGSSGGGVKSANPVHASETCSVFFATDESLDKNNDKYHVALKLIKVEDHFDRELGVRLNVSPSEVASGEDIDERNTKFHNDHVVPLYRYHKENDVLDEYGNKCYCLVMAKGTKSLHHIIDSERIAGRDVSKIKFYGEDMAKAIKHIHDEGYIHGDMKPRNIIRAPDGDIKAIDLDATVQIGNILSNKKKSTAYISPEVARIEFRPTECIQDLEKEYDEAQNMLKQLTHRHPQFKETVKKCDSLELKIDLINANKQDSTNNLKADIQMDIWGFGLTMYYLCTNKESLFKAKQANDALEDEEQKNRLLNWKGLTEDDVKKILPNCKQEDRKTRDKAVAFLKKCLHGDINERFQSMDEIIEDPFFTGANDVDKAIAEFKEGQNKVFDKMDELKEGQNQIHEAVLENAELMVKLENIKNPYIFMVLDEENYKNYIRAHVVSLNDTTESDASPLDLINQTIERGQDLLTFVEETLDETMQRKEAPKRLGGLFGGKHISYIVVQCGLTFKPVIAYKVKDVKYNEKMEKAAKACAKVCAVGLKVSTVWNTGANITKMFGYPLPQIPEETLKKANDFFKNVNSSSKVTDFLNKDDGLTMQELQDFGELLNDLESAKRVCFYLGNEGKDKCSEKKWSHALIRYVLQMKDGKRTITYISKNEAARAGYKQDEVKDLA